MKLKFIKALMSIVFLSVSVSAKADILLLIHGFQSDMLVWQKAGIIDILEKHGWQKTDYLMTTPKGLVPLQTPESKGSKKIVNLQLPSDIKLRYQADMVSTALHYLADHYPNEPVIIVGHSLGGLTARLSLVKNGHFQVKGLITIATPHLGTKLALLGMNELDNSFMMTWVKRMLGGREFQVLENSAPVIYDLLPERQGNMLFALNRQPHPNIAYLSVVRLFPNGTLGDTIVSGYSQDMNNVVALNQRSKRLFHGHQHELTQYDAYAILNALDLIK